MSRSRCVPLAVVALVVGLFAGSAPTHTTAQDTGGSFGGSDFGGGGGSDYGGGGSDYGGGGSDYGGSSDYGSSSYGGSNDYSSGSSSGSSSDGGALCCIFIFFVGLMIVMAIVGRKNAATPGRGAVQQAYSPTPAGGGDVSAIRIALDHHARPALQAKLDALARSGASGTKAGRVTALHEVCIELRRNQTSWLFASVDNSPVSSLAAIEQKYRQAAADARSRFRVETVRSGDGATTEAPDTTTRDRGEGPGIVVVTVVVAARREIVDVRTPDDAGALTQLLTAFGGLNAAELMGLEVIWSPSAEDDRMTVDELGRVYPEMRLIRSETIAGRLFCGYCGSPFRHELSRCPHCGAPAVDGRPKTPGTPETPTA
jgi:uncharacterized membrane protein